MGASSDDPPCPTLLGLPQVVGVAVQVLAAADAGDVACCIVVAGFPGHASQAVTTRSVGVHLGARIAGHPHAVAGGVVVVHLDDRPAGAVLGLGESTHAVVAELHQRGAASPAIGSDHSHVRVVA